MRPPFSLLMDHIDYIVKIVGIDYVGLGSDFDGIESSPQGLDGVEDFPKITEELMKRGILKKTLRKFWEEIFCAYSKPMITTGVFNKNVYIGKIINLFLYSHLYPGELFNSIIRVNKRVVFQSFRQACIGQKIFFQFDIKRDGGIERGAPDTGASNS